MLRRGWMVLVAILVITGAGFTVYRLQGIFGSDHNTATPGGTADQIVPFNPKSVVLEVFGEPGARAMISYTDVDARPQHLANAALPWSYRESTTDPAVIVNIMAQSDGSTLGCRIVIDGVVKAQRVVDIPGAYTFCLDKSG